MFGRKKTVATVQAPEEKPEKTLVPKGLIVDVDVETYAISTGAARIRRLEMEMHETFEEWYSTQKSSAEKGVLVGFKMSPTLEVAWQLWLDRQHEKEGTPQA